MPKILKWMLAPLVLLAVILSFFVYRWSDEALTSEAQSLQAQQALPQIIQSLNYPVLEQFKLNPCILKQPDPGFVSRWQQYQKLNSNLIKDLLEHKIKSAIVHSPDSITGFKTTMAQNRNWIRHFEMHICFLQQTDQDSQASQLLETFAGSVLKSLELIQPLPQVIQNLQLLNSIVVEMKEVPKSLAQSLLGLEAENLLHQGHRFHFQSILNSIQNLKTKTRSQPQVFFPVLLIQPRRLMNQLALVSQDPNQNVPAPHSGAPWYDVKNLEQIYISIFQKSVQGQREEVEEELEKLNSYLTDFGHGPVGLENDKSRAHQSK